MLAVSLQRVVSRDRYSLTRSCVFALFVGGLGPDEWRVRRTSADLSSDGSRRAFGARRGRAHAASGRSPPAPALGVFLESPRYRLRRGPHDSGMTGPNRPALWSGSGYVFPSAAQPSQDLSEATRGAKIVRPAGHSILAPPASPDRATRGLNGRREDTGCGR
jgi:hypothetical protein